MNFSTLPRSSLAAPALSVAMVSLNALVSDARIRRASAHALAAACRASSRVRVVLSAEVITEIS